MLGGVRDLTSMARSVGRVASRMLLVVPLISLLIFLWLPGDAVTCAFVVAGGGIGRIKRHVQARHVLQRGLQLPVAAHRIRRSLGRCRRRVVPTLSVVSGVDATTARCDAADAPLLSDGGLAAGLSGREAVARASESLVPLFAEVDAHTQR